MVAAHHQAGQGRTIRPTEQGFIKTRKDAYPLVTSADTTKHYSTTRTITTIALDCDILKNSKVPPQSG